MSRGQSVMIGSVRRLLDSKHNYHVASFKTLCVAVLTTVALTAAVASANLTVGLYFVEGQDEPIDFLTKPGQPAYNFIEPWQMTAPSNQFVMDGAFIGTNEQDVRAAVISAIKQKYFSIPSPGGYVLDIEFLPYKATGPGTVNVIMGRHNSTRQTWFGYAALGGGLGEINGENNAAVSIDRIDSLLTEDFTTFDGAVNAIANVAAHETAHLFWLEHVWADDRADLGWSGEPVVTDPYDVMATGPSGLPDSGWLEDNIFTTVSNTQAGGHSSVSMLIDRIGLKLIGDTDRDGDVDNADIGTTTGSFTGSNGATDKLWADGDMDFDGDVDNADIGAVTGAFTGSGVSSPVTSSTAADLLYDPATGNVQLDASEAAGSVITNFQIENTDGTFDILNYNRLFDGAFGQATGETIGDTDMTFAGLAGVADLGDIFPVGLDAAGLEAYLKTASYVGAAASGQQTFDLVVIPEPSSLTLVGLGGWILFRRSRRGG
jgi:hypothetical protein